MKPPKLPARPVRKARLGSEEIHFTGAGPGIGRPLDVEFSLPAARAAKRPLTASDLRRGLVVLSTLPNIQRNACLSQIVALEKLGRRLFPGMRLVHVSADSPAHWREVDDFHGDLTAPGYTLFGARLEDAFAFAEAFGVQVEGHRRIAHGLFALRDGVLLEAQIPEDQMAPPNVALFLRRLKAHLGDSFQEADADAEQEREAALQAAREVLADSGDELWTDGD